MPILAWLTRTDVEQVRPGAARTQQVGFVVGVVRRDGRPPPAAGHIWCLRGVARLLRMAINAAVADVERAASQLLRGVGFQSRWGSDIAQNEVREPDQSHNRNTNYAQRSYYQLELGDFSSHDEIRG